MFLQFWCTVVAPFCKSWRFNSYVVLSLFVRAFQLWRCVPCCTDVLTIFPSFLRCDRIRNHLKLLNHLLKFYTFPTDWIKHLPIPPNQDRGFVLAIALQKVEIEEEIYRKRKQFSLMTYSAHRHTEPITFSYSLQWGSHAMLGMIPASNFCLSPCWHNLMWQGNTQNLVRDEQTIVFIFICSMWPPSTAYQVVYASHFLELCENWLKSLGSAVAKK